MSFYMNFLCTINIINFPTNPNLNETNDNMYLIIISQQNINS